MKRGYDIRYRAFTQVLTTDDEAASGPATTPCSTAFGVHVDVDVQSRVWMNVQSS